MAEGLKKVCVAIPTFRRPDGLAQLLSALSRQRVPEGYVVTLLVLDNDRIASAQATVESHRDGLPFELLYRHVPEPGLTVVRNAAIAFARSDFLLLAMVDDDEVPVPDWLAELLRIERETDSDAVVGPVPQALPPGAPRWIRAGRFFDLPTFRDGARMDFGYSGNCLLRVASLERYRLLFDPALNFAGGEDMLFFRQLLAAGGRLSFAAHATAVEKLPPDRLRASYLLRLHYRRGNTLAICDRKLAGTRAALLSRALKAAARVVLGVIQLLPFSFLRGRAGAMIALCNVAQGFGSVAGLGGHVYHAYRRVNQATS